MTRLFDAAVLVATLALGGCLQKETTHTLYLWPDGRTTWAALEAHVRSDDPDPGRRNAEEQSYLTAVPAGVHDVGRGLAALDPLRLRATVVRSDRPFTALTEAEFASIADLAARLVQALGIQATVDASDARGASTLTVRIDTAAASLDAAPESAAPLAGLAEDLDRYAIVLAEGRFTGAAGFVLADGGTRAEPDRAFIARTAKAGGILELSLTWTR